MEENKKDIQEELKEGLKEEIKKEISDENQEEVRYKTLVTLEENLWTYGSPVIFERGVLERDQLGKRNMLTLNFTNVDQRVISDVFVTIFVSDDEGNASEVEHQYSALGQKYLASKGAGARIFIGNENARTFKIKVDGVKFQDGSYWYKEDAVYENTGAMEDIEVFAELKAKDYEDNYVSGKEEVAKDDSASIGNGIEILRRVIWYKNASELLKDAKKKYEIAKINEERKQAREDSFKKRKKAIRKKYITVGCILAVIVAIVAAAMIMFFIPNNKYKAAKKYIDSKKYDKAVEAFSELNGFLKSEEYLAQAYYNLGLEALEKDDEKKASEYFNKSHDAAEKSQYGMMAGAYLDYYSGTEALNAKEYDKALEYFKTSTNAASDFNLINKASAGMAQINYTQKNYEAAWNTIKNVYAKDTTYEQQYAEYGYEYAKSLVDLGKITEGMEIYNQVSKLTDKADLYESVYLQAAKLGAAGKISESMKLLEKIKKNYSKANKLYEHMYAFNDKVKLWLGEWKHTGKVNGEKKTYTITISQVLYKGEMCLRIKDMNNKYLGFDTVISKKNKVTQIVIGTYQLHFKLKNYHDQKFTFSLKEGNKMERLLKYNGEKYKTTYKKSKK